MHKAKITVRKVLQNVTVLDWIVIAVFIGAALYLVTMSLKKEQWIVVEMKVTVAREISGSTSPPNWIVENVKQGDVQFDSYGGTNFEVLDVKNWGWGYKQTWITARVKTKYNPSQKRYTFQFQPLEVGLPIMVTINDTNISGIVTYVEGQDRPAETFDVVVETRLLGNSNPDMRGIDAWIADSFSEGDIMKDGEGNVVAEILSKTVRPADRVVTTADGRVLLTKDPIKKDVFMTVRLKTTKENDTYFFLEENAIKVGHGFPLFLNKAELGPVITEIHFPDD